MEQNINKNAANELGASAFMPTEEKMVSILKKRAQIIATQSSNIENEKNDLTYIHFCLGKNEQYGIPYQYAKEVLQKPPLTFAPYSPNFISGVINRRGVILPIIDLKILFGINKSSENEQAIIVIESDKITMGILVDSIIGNVNYSLTDLDPPLLVNKNIKPEYITGLHNGIIAIINIKEILLDSKLEIKK